MPTYAITLAPEKKLWDKITSIKKEACHLVGKQQYLQDQPHLTLFIGNFEEYIQFSDRIKKIISAIPKPQFEIISWHVFEKDPVTQKDTLVCNLDDKSAESLRPLQKKIIEILLPFKKKENFVRYAHISFKGDFKSNLEHYGYPFVGKIWKPHFGIASFDHASFTKVWEIFKNKCPLGDFVGEVVQLYALDAEEKLTLLASYPFGRYVRRTQEKSLQSKQRLSKT